MVALAGGIPGRVIWLWCNKNHIARDFQPAIADTHTSLQYVTAAYNKNEESATFPPETNAPHSAAPLQMNAKEFVIIGHNFLMVYSTKINIKYKCVSFSHS